jgi:tRNA(adenine34) deaminase
LRQAFGKGLRRCGILQVRAFRLAQETVVRLKLSMPAGDCPFEKLRPSALVRDDGYFMALAYNLAVDAFRAEEVPVGAVIVKKGEVIASAANQVEALRDATAHAEMLALTAAAKALGDWRLEGCTLYVTKEPCPMCAGGMMLSRVERVVYGMADPKMGGVGGACRINELPESFHRYKAEIGPLQVECAALLKAFFSRKR